MTLDEFIQKVCQRPLPTNPMARIRILAKELAEGAVEGVWNDLVGSYNGLFTDKDGNRLNKDGRWGMRGDKKSRYFEVRWADEYPDLQLLESNNYLRETNHGYYPRLTEKAFNLLSEVEPTNIFISYKRSQSSVFALLVLARLKEVGLEPFLDMALVPGEDWHKGLKERIEKYDYFITLLGPDTLSSEVVIDEIGWALDAGLAIIPIWHNGFEYKSEDWPNVPLKIDHILKHTHTIRVVEENPLEYDKALTELLNLFGFTP